MDRSLSTVDLCEVSGSPGWACGIVKTQEEPVRMQPAKVRLRPSAAPHYKQTPNILQYIDIDPIPVL